MYYRGVARSEEVRVRPYTLLLEATRAGDGLECRMETRLGPERIRCSRLVLATGYYDHPNMMGVAGEELPHVHHYFDEAHRSSGQRVVVIGGKNSAVEAALELFRAGARVTLVYRRSEFRPSVKYWMVPDIRNRIAAGEIEARFGAEVMEIEQTCVIIRAADGSREELPCDRVYALTGYRPDFDLFRRVGIELDPETCAPAMNPETHGTNVRGVYMAGSITTGWETSDVFIENGRFDGEKIFADVVRGS
jgi:thioredoxin reductase (NADPH)